MASDHAVFKRLSRQQLIVRRRNVGAQVLIFTTSVEAVRCRRCARSFNATWKALLCHVCGLWACHTCSSVIESERTLHVIRFVRACVPCMNLVTKWPDPSLFADNTATPWVRQCIKSQLGMNLADVLRSVPYWRHAVVTLLRHLGQPVSSSDAYEELGAISELDWISTTTNHAHDVPSHTNRQGIELVATLSNEPTASLPSDNDGQVMTSSAPHRLSRRELAHVLVQQCFDVAIDDVPVAKCVFAEADGTRTYPVVFDDATECPVDAPRIATDAMRATYIERYGLRAHGATNTLELQLLCDLAAKELDASSAFISIVYDDVHESIACRPQTLAGACGARTKRAQSMCAFALATRNTPFFVRDAALDFRFRNLDIVARDATVRCYLGFPIVAAASGTHVASLCITDTMPRRQISTTQYAVLSTLAATVARIWEAQHSSSTTS